MQPELTSLEEIGRWFSTACINAKFVRTELARSQRVVASHVRRADLENGSVVLQWLRVEMRPLTVSHVV